MSDVSNRRYEELFLRKVSPRLLLAVGLVAITVLACQSIGGRTVSVDFSSAEGLEAGRPVYFAGVRVGTTGEPAIVGGRARVPVRLMRRHRDALPAGTVFVIAADPNKPGESCLRGYDLGTAAPRRSGDVYPGFSDELELTLLVGAQKARELWEAYGDKP